MRVFGTTIALLLSAPTAAMAEGTMPQMDFHNPLTGTQVLWMAVILVVLYAVLARWGLPEVGKVLENRSAVIDRDLAAARGAKTAADEAVAQLNVTIKLARDTAQAQIAAAVAQAKAEAALFRPLLSRPNWTSNWRNPRRRLLRRGARRWPRSNPWHPRRLARCCTD